MTYNETIDYLYNTLPMFSRMGSAAFKKDLTNITALCRHLENPQNHFKTIHVGGTNGKGSTSHMLAAVLQTAGYKTGLYTSPHLQDFRERIKVNGQMVPEAFVVDFVQRMQPVIETIQPSFFEITVAMAFAYFAEQGVDVAIIEVGLGGRLDSTNIIQPELSVITNIGLDHMDMLGTTLPQIAAEKGGIIKQGTPVVIGEKHPETQTVFKKLAKGKEAPIYFAQDHFTVNDYYLTATNLSVEVTNNHSGTTNHYILDLPGIYQTKNIVTVLQAIELLQQKCFSITEAQIHQALAQTKKLTGLHGRWEVMAHKPTVVLEVAHNEDGMQQMLQHIKQLKFRHLHLVMGMVKDKDIEKVLALLPADATYYFTQAHIPRALDAAQLQQKAAGHQLNGATYTNVNEALQQAVAAAAAKDLIIVCGSIFLVAEVDKGVIKNHDS